MSGALELPFLKLQDLHRESSDWLTSSLRYFVALPWVHYLHQRLGGVGVEVGVAGVGGLDLVRALGKS